MREVIDDTGMKPPEQMPHVLQAVKVPRLWVQDMVNCVDSGGCGGEEKRAGKKSIS